MKWSSEALLEKAKNVRAMLDQMAMHPSEVETLKEITGIFTDGSLDVSERVMALERLDDMVAQIDLAFDFHRDIRIEATVDGRRERERSDGGESAGVSSVRDVDEQLRKDSGNRRG